MLVFKDLNVGKVANALAHVNPVTLAKFVSTYVYHEWQIDRQNKKGIVAPTQMHIELTTFCPKRCEGCYIPLTDKLDPQVMSKKTAREAVRRGLAAKIRIYHLLGGEPVSENTLPLIQMLVESYPWAAFYVCTNASYLARHGDSAGVLLKAHNLSMNLSVDGFKATSDSIRGRGSYADVMGAASRLRELRCFFGATAAVLPGNFDEILSPDFLMHLKERGFSYLFYSTSHSSELIPQMEVLAKGGFYRKSPLPLYVNALGNLGNFSPNSWARLAYVAKNGQVLNDRQERVVVGDLEVVHQLGSMPQWAKKYRAQGMAGKAQAAYEMTEKTAYRLEEAEAAPYLF